jgi:hypothetical protein
VNAFHLDEPYVRQDRHVPRLDMFFEPVKAGEERLATLEKIDAAQANGKAPEGQATVDDRDTIGVGYRPRS